MTSDHDRTRERSARLPIPSSHGPVWLDLERVFVDAGELSGLYTEKFDGRSLDLLHVAAHAALCTTFVSADDR